MGQAPLVTIKGVADTAYLTETKTIYAYTYSDYISYREQELARVQLDEKGNFTLAFSVSQITHIFLVVDNAKAEMVVEPGKTYDLTLFAKDSDAVNTLSLYVPIEIEFNNSEPTELNYLLADFSNRYEAFLEYHHPLISKKNPDIFGKIDTMRSLSKAKYASYNKPYLNNYIDYTFASLEENITLKEKENMFYKHVSGKPVLLNNYDYMLFFHQFYSVTSSFFMNNSKTLNEINGKQNFSSLMDLFKESSLLVNDTIRETVLLKSLSEYARYPGYKANAVLAILDQATTQCKAVENRRAAENLKRKLSVMLVGKPAPALSFQDMAGKAVSLADFKGKYIYVNFWATWCSSCTQDMTLIPELKKSYGGKIIFVSISVDKNPETVKNFLKKNPKLSPEKNGSGWVFLTSDNYKKVKEEFNVLTVPTYYLIDTKGNVLRSPAATPADIEPDLMKIKQRK